MNIAEKIIDNQNVSKDEIKYLLWLVLCEHQQYINGDVFPAVDDEECFNVNDMLDALEKQLNIHLI